MKEIFLIAALALPSFQKEKPFSDADRAAFAMFKAINDDVQIMKFDDDLPRKIMRLSPGGFIFVSGEYARIKLYFKNRDFEPLPFLWRNHVIYRKKMRGFSA